SCCFLFLSLFFFSSRRRHTRFSRDWSSDVCSSDLTIERSLSRFIFSTLVWKLTGLLSVVHSSQNDFITSTKFCFSKSIGIRLWRSEERRVGKKCKSRWLTCVRKKKLQRHISCKIEC